MQPATSLHWVILACVGGFLIMTMLLTGFTMRRPMAGIAGSAVTVALWGLIAYVYRTHGVPPTWVSALVAGLFATIGIIAGRRIIRTDSDLERPS